MSTIFTPLKFLKFFLVFSLMGLLAVGNAHALISSVTEEDGSPSTFPWRIKFANGTVTDNSDGTVSVSGGGSGAPTDADYLVGTTNGSLSAEIVVGTTPGGELGNTWASPTLDDSVTTTGWVMGTFTGTTLTIDTEAYTRAGWNADNSVPTKDAVSDRDETLATRTIGSFCASTLSTTMNCENSRVYVPSACTPQGVYLTATTAPTGASILVDVNECSDPGTCVTLFATQGNRPAIVATATSGNSVTFDDTSVAAGNYIGIDIDQVGSGTAGSNLTITVVCKV